MDPLPIKRSPHLIILSRDHHQGLLICWKIRQAIRGGVAPGRIAPYVMEAMRVELFPHFDLEEKYLFPLLPAMDEMRKQLEKDHLLLRQRVRELTTDPAPEQLSSLADALDDHIRFEERKLFPRMEATLPLQALQEAASSLESHHADSALSWPDPFWIIAHKK